MTEAATEKATSVPSGTKSDDLNLKYFGMTKNQDTYYCKQTHKCTENTIVRLSENEIYQYESLQADLEKTLTKSDQIQQLHAVAKILEEESSHLGTAKDNRESFKELIDLNIKDEWLVYAENQIPAIEMLDDISLRTNPHLREQARDKMRGYLSQLDKTKFQPLMHERTKGDLETSPEFTLVLIIVLKYWAQRNQFVMNWVNKQFGTLIKPALDEAGSETPGQVLERINNYTDDFVHLNNIRYVGELYNLTLATGELFERDNGPTMAEYWQLLDLVNRILKIMKCINEIAMDDHETIVIIYTAQSITKILAHIVPSKVPLDDKFTQAYIRKFREEEMKQDRYFGIKWFEDLRSYLKTFEKHVPKNLRPQITPQEDTVNTSDLNALTLQPPLFVRDFMVKSYKSRQTGKPQSWSKDEIALFKVMSEDFFSGRAKLSAEDEADCKKYIDLRSINKKKISSYSTVQNNVLMRDASQLMLLNYEEVTKYTKPEKSQNRSCSGVANEEALMHVALVPQCKWISETGHPLMESAVEEFNLSKFFTMSSDGLNRDLVFTDSGSQRHFCGDNKYFIKGTQKPCNNFNIRVGDDRVFQAEAVGDILLSEGTPNQFILKDVIYSPKLQHIGLIIGFNYWLRMENDNLVKIMPEVKEFNFIQPHSIYIGRRTGNETLYWNSVYISDNMYIDFQHFLENDNQGKPMFTKNCFSSIDEYLKSKNANPIKVMEANLRALKISTKGSTKFADILVGRLHQCAHIRPQVIVDGLKCGAIQASALREYSPEDYKGIVPSMSPCLECQMGKMVEGPYPSNLRGLDRPGELMAADVATGLPESVSGNKAVVIIVDQHSYYIFHRCLKTKDQVPAVIVDLDAIMTRQTGTPIKVLRTDLGGEFVSKNFKEWLAKNGIQHETAAAGHHEQNGRAEVAIRDIFARVRAVLKTCGLPVNYWDYCVDYVILVYNHMFPHKIRSTGAIKVPASEMFGKSIDVSLFPLFGTNAMVVIQPDQRGNHNKLQDRASPAIFVGYVRGMNAARFLLMSGRVVFSNNASVVDGDYGHVEKFNEIHQSSLDVNKLLNMTHIPMRENNDDRNWGEEISILEDSVTENKSHNGASLQLPRLKEDGSRKRKAVDVLKPVEIPSKSGYSEDDVKRGKTVTDHDISDSEMKDPTWKPNDSGTSGLPVQQRLPSVRRNQVPFEVPVSTLESTGSTGDEQTAAAGIDDGLDPKGDGQAATAGIDDGLDPRGDGRKAAGMDDEGRDSKENYGPTLAASEEEVPKSNALPGVPEREESRPKSKKRGRGRPPKVHKVWDERKSSAKRRLEELEEEDSKRRRIIPRRKTRNMFLLSGFEGFEDKEPPTWDPELKESDVKIPKSLMEALNSEFGEQWLFAVFRELKSMEAKNVFADISEQDRNKNKAPLLTMWVFSVKTEDMHVVKFKARLVIRGDKQHPNDYEEISAPTLNVGDLRVFLAYCTQLGLCIHQMDIETAFLNSPVDVDLCAKVQTPADLKTKKLLKSVYGLKQAPLRWYLHLKENLLKMGFEKLNINCNTFQRGSDATKVYIVVYVDDLLVASRSTEVVESVKAEIKSIFKAKDFGPVKKLLGLNFTQDLVNGYTKIDAHEYIQSMAEGAGETGFYTTDRPMIAHFPDNATEGADVENLNHILPSTLHHTYREVVGKLRYLTSTVRPDIAYAVRRLSHFLSSPTYHHLKALRTITRYVYATPTRGLVYRQSEKQLIAYADASFAPKYENCDGVSGIVILYGGAPVIWDSKRIGIKINGTMDSELVALFNCTKFLDGVISYLSDLGCLIDRAVPIYEDNMPLITSMSGKVDYKTPTLRQKFNSIRLDIQSKRICIKEIETDSQLADIFTKALVSEKFKSQVKALGMIDQLEELVSEKMESEEIGEC